MHNRKASGQHLKRFEQDPEKITELMQPIQFRFIQPRLYRLFYLPGTDPEQDSRLGRNGGVYTWQRIL